MGYKRQYYKGKENCKYYDWLSKRIEFKNEVDRLELSIDDILENVISYWADKRGGISWANAREQLITKLEKRGG